MSIKKDYPIENMKKIKNSLRCLFRLLFRLIPAYRNKIVLFMDGEFAAKCRFMCVGNFLLLENLMFITIFLP